MGTVCWLPRFPASLDVWDASYMIMYFLNLLICDTPRWEWYTEAYMDIKDVKSRFLKLIFL